MATLQTSGLNLGPYSWLTFRLRNLSVASLLKKEEQITKLEARLRKGGVPVECIQRISMAMASKHKQGSSSPTLKIKGEKWVL